MTGNRQHLRWYLTLRGILGGIRKHPGFSCPVCGRTVPLDGPPEDLRLRCPNCDAGLVIGLKRDWLLAPVCLALGLAIAYAQGLSNPEVWIYALIYSGALVFLAIPLLAPFFPLELKRAPEDFIQTLGVPPK